MTPEGIVVTEVVNYFSVPKFKRFSIQKEYPIQMGSDNRRADVVLINEDENLAAIIECKKLGYQGAGLDQLKSYLSATDTPLGAFANSKDSDSWIFIENLRQNQFREITRSEFENRVLKTGIKGLKNFVKRFFSAGRDSQHEPRPPLVRPPQERTHISNQGEDQTMQNKNGSDSVVNPSLNGSPYCSEQNGFYWATNHRGFSECVPQHVKLIISNEREKTINHLVDERKGLEEQKRDCEQKIEQKNQKLYQKKEALAELEIQLQATKEPELNLLPEPRYDAAKQLLKEEISQLREKKDTLEREIEQNSQELAQKKEKLAKFEIELEAAPPKLELNLLSVEGSSEYATTPSKQSEGLLIQRIIHIIFSAFTTVALFGLMFYLFVFYASAGDKAFSSGQGSVQQQLNEIVSHDALFLALQEGNWFVLLFPFIFLVLAIVTHFFFVEKKWAYLVSVLIVTFMLDGIIAIKISQRIHDDKMRRGLLEETEKWTIMDLNILAVLLLGFAVSLLLSCVFYCTLKLWEKVGQSNVTEQERKEKKYKDEKTQREARIAVLKAKMENLQIVIDQHKEKVKATEQKIEDRETKIGDLSKQQMEAHILVLKAEVDNLQAEIDQLNSKNTINQQKIEEVQEKIEEELKQRDKRVVDKKKIESQVNQFLNGWCRFVTHSENGTIDVSPQIEKIRQVASETLDQYYEGLPEDYSP